MIRERISLGYDSITNKRAQVQERAAENRGGHFGIPKERLGAGHAVDKRRVYGVDYEWRLLHGLDVSALLRSVQRRCVRDSAAFRGGVCGTDALSRALAGLAQQ